MSITSAGLSTGSLQKHKGPFSWAAHQESWELLLSPQAAAHHAGYWLPEEGHATGADGPASTEVVGDKMTAASKISKNYIF